MLVNYDFAFFKKGSGWIIRFHSETLIFKDSLGLKYIHYLILNKGKEINTVDLHKVGGSKIVSKNSNVSNDDDLNKSNSEEEFDSQGYESRDPQWYDSSLINIAREKTIPSGRMADDRYLEDCVKKLNKILKGMEIAKKEGDKEKIKDLKAEQSKMLKDIFKVYDKDQFKLYLQGKIKSITPRSFDEDKKNLRKSVVIAISRAIQDMLGDRNSDNKELRKKLWQHFEDALRPISKQNNSYSPKKDIDWFLG